MKRGKYFIQSHRLHKNVTVETECAFRTPKAARSAAPPEAKRALRAAAPIEVAALRAAGQAKARNQCFEAAVLGPAKHLADRVRGSEARAHF